MSTPLRENYLERREEFAKMCETRPLDDRKVLLCKLKFENKVNREVISDLIEEVRRHEDGADFKVFICVK